MLLESGPWRRQLPAVGALGPQPGLGLGLTSLDSRGGKRELELHSTLALLQAGADLLEAGLARPFRAWRPRAHCRRQSSGSKGRELPEGAERPSGALAGGGPCSSPCLRQADNRQEKRCATLSL
eukprot:15344235-Alexandrium_andersonii.AAC.1